MSTTETRVIVTPGATAQATRVHHRDFPEIRADGPTPKAAAEHLANLLVRALDSALTDWRRDTLNRAADDVKAFVQSSGA
jgi:hypothetical protein